MGAQDLGVGLLLERVGPAGLQRRLLHQHAQLLRDGARLLPRLPKLLQRGPLAPLAAAPRNVNTSTDHRLRAPLQRRQPRRQRRLCENRHLSREDEVLDDHESSNADEALREPEHGEAVERDSLSVADEEDGADERRDVTKGTVEAVVLHEAGEDDPSGERDDGEDGTGALRVERDEVAEDGAEHHPVQAEVRDAEGAVAVGVEAHPDYQRRPVDVVAVVRGARVGAEHHSQRDLERHDESLPVVELENLAEKPPVKLDLFFTFALLNWIHATN
ncbi:uncharacterized protein LOC112343175 [Selaginella moellendorffii]|uniref:uncharacterized protein LOC112343175 n=1 Tax=Selaginella moellendorffii TaxID=88036 RepID=UPI000D1CC174|nr:uncharacterized protein LOC112343175 [Selaginella moellendorffii]|eukprot:XP_024522014.1 uncharacterized protein LOC112343175 [Selaginella moellendorffii]